MKKKVYMKPSMKVYEMAQTSRILCASDEWTRLPDQQPDEKQLA